MRTLLKAVGMFVLVMLAGCNREKAATVHGVPEKKLTVIVPASVTVVRGGATDVLIKIKRDNFTGPISISIDGLPKGVSGSLLEALKKIDGNEGTFTLNAGADAPLVEKSVAHVTAKGPENLAVTESVKISVVEKQAAAPAGSDRKLSLSVPDGVTVERGGASAVLVKIKRENFQGPIAISIDKLPKGVTVNLLEALKAIDGDEGTFTLKASDNAPLVESSVAEVTAKGPNSLTKTEPLNVRVVEKK